MRLPREEISKAEKAKQSRSYFYGVRRKFKKNKIEPFFAEMRKPTEIIKSEKGDANINIKGNFKTDVEAAVAYCVMSHIFKICVAKIRKDGKKPYRPGQKKGGGLLLQCHTALIQRQLDKDNARLPDCTRNSEVADFCKRCVADFREIAVGVKSGELHIKEGVT